MQLIEHHFNLAEGQLSLLHVVPVEIIKLGVQLLNVSFLEVLHHALVGVPGEIVASRIVAQAGVVKVHAAPPADQHLVQRVLRLVAGGAQAVQIALGCADADGDGQARIVNGLANPCVEGVEHRVHALRFIAVDDDVQVLQVLGAAHHVLLVGGRFLAHMANQRLRILKVLGRIASVAGTHNVHQRHGKVRLLQLKELAVRQQAGVLVLRAAADQTVDDALLNVGGDRNHFLAVAVALTDQAADAPQQIVHVVAGAELRLHHLAHAADGLVKLPGKAVGHQHENDSQQQDAAKRSDHGGGKGCAKDGLRHIKAVADAAAKQAAGCLEGSALQLAEIH